MVCSKDLQIAYKMGKIIYRFESSAVVMSIKKDKLL